jgi:hypothetical protein
MKPLRSGSLAVLLLSLVARGAHADETTTRSVQARAYPAAQAGAVGPARLDFLFGDTRGWLDSDGTWSVSADVTHRGLLCATYELGVRFGSGEPDCTNVRWLGAVRYVTAERQCNNATVRQSGGDKQPELASDFGRITCAERVIRCTGNCK